MKLHNIDEPLLEFGRGTHVCPRAGIESFGVYDTRLNARRDKLLIGAISTSDNLSKFAEWIDRCSKPIPQKAETAQPELFRDFCGFNRDTGFSADLVLEDEITRSLSNSDIKNVLEIKNREERINAAVDLFFRQVKFLAQNRVVDVIVCIVPTKLYEKISKEEAEPVENSLDDMEVENLETNFRRLLKAKTMHLGKPIQIMRELSLESNPKTQQDDATKAWNFSTAIYYKANQTIPWKLITNINRPSVCYVGIGFYRSRDKKSLRTSLAQIFDELGNGVILRGTPVKVTKDDPVPHLSDEQVYDLLRQALSEYEMALDTSPGRVVIHKSSNYNQQELSGLNNAIKEMKVNAVDFVTVLDTKIRLLREGIYPPYRGTHIELDASRHILYTRGSVKYYRTYPGRYIPQPLEVRIVESDESPGQICKEILGLTKMNWNNTQFDGKYPITLECARKVGQVMKYVDENEKPQIRYSFYM